ncbi:MAG TPA: BadF/BadG/BcrA/BcrD ATPase family protein [Bacteroidales bacterium]|jgi:type II pantothenate kinase|nr:BadF/BadG/BcrA/BcrD ATPase family protein [Bacteroidales bacterium]HQH22991.1 BadF/BadG/BcrA/BcrD ATPase family protein [Bacteroidales bacterium]HQJ82154.1 BadF/BadG/BcrA/BcrD ATPase family protein [Bacteroidales bacterium]
MVIGIDIGSTTTKVAAIMPDKEIIRIKTRAIDAITSATGAFGKLIVENHFSLDSIKKINITGVGAARITDNLFGIKTNRVGEMTAIGTGGKYLAKKDRIIISNIGTGTAIIEVDGSKINHLGGTGVGGGTIIGLSKIMLGTTDFDTIMQYASKGSINNVDLLIGDIADTNISFLDKEFTASNFGKMLDIAGKEDLAMGIFNLTYQVIAMVSVFAAKSKNNDTVVVTGKGSNNPIGQNILKRVSRVHKINFEFPADAEYATAIGAALSV